MRRKKKSGSQTHASRWHIKLWSPYYTVHLQKTYFAASNHMVTHHPAYFVKINSKHPRYTETNNQTTHQLWRNLRRRRNHRRRVTHVVTHDGRNPSPATFFIFGQTQSENIEKSKLNLKIDSNASKIDSNTSKFILDSKLKP
jgi:hypothetical protein